MEDFKNCVHQFTDKATEMAVKLMNTILCKKHIKKEFIHKPTGGMRTKMLDETLPYLHLRNEFSLKPKRKASSFHLSPRKMSRPRSEQTQGRGEIVAEPVTEDYWLL